MREYGTVDVAIWRHGDFKALSDDAKLMALYLRTCDHGNLIGCFHLPVGYMAADLRWPASKCLQTISQLSVNGFARYCERTEYVLIPKHLEKFPLKNPNQVTGALNCWSDIPGAFAYLAEITELLAAQEKVGESDRERLRNRLATAEQRNAAPDPEPEPDPEQEKTLSAPAAPLQDAGPSLRTKKGKTLRGPLLQRFEEFWIAFAYKRGKAEAADAWLALNPGPDLTAKIVAAARKEASNRPAQVAAGQTPKMAQGWLSARRFEDEDPPALPQERKNGAGGYLIHGERIYLPAESDDRAMGALAKKLGVSLLGLNRRDAHAKVKSTLERLEREGVRSNTCVVHGSHTPEWAD